MSDRPDPWLLLPAPVRRLPADLAAVTLLVLLTVVAVFAPVVRETPLRIVLGLPFVLFVPGYAFVAALFPEAGEGPVDEELEDPEAVEASRDGGIDGIERVALSFGLSIAIVPLIGLVLNFTPWGIRLTPIMVAVSGFTLVAVALGAVRRWELPQEERFSVPYRSWIAGGREEMFEPDSRADAALNVVLVLSILLAVSSVGYAVAVPKQGESFSELYLLTQNETGDLVADDYPTEFTHGEPRELVVGIGNHEHETVNYSVVVMLQNVTFVTNESRVRSANGTVTPVYNETRVLEEERMRTFETTLGQNETWIQPHSIEPTMAGEDLRLTYLLYRGEVPSEPSVDGAYREVHLWVNVSRTTSR
ncbi:DUF1616 domain-containing protein [Haloglomus litoreum]|uniref:DUF1616 domain-containing protein n=1 Tax=Haloglomus litoreum TaxID=3034026 RepID=UPI0023E84EDF|nr:DUF1616 domain-containing protein [Haloglomus sp. DT116]